PSAGPLDRRGSASDPGHRTSGEARSRSASSRLAEDDGRIAPRARYPCRGAEESNSGTSRRAASSWTSEARALDRFRVDLAERTPKHADREARDEIPPGRVADARAHLRVRRELSHPAAELFVIAGRDQRARATVFDDLGNRAEATADDRQAVALRLDVGEA